MRLVLNERDDRFFEEVVLDVLVALGYGGSKPDAAERVGRSGDGGDRWCHPRRHPRPRCDLRAGEEVGASDVLPAEDYFVEPE